MNYCRQAFARNACARVTSSKNTTSGSIVVFFFFVLIRLYIYYNNNFFVPMSSCDKLVWAKIKAPEDSLNRVILTSFGPSPVPANQFVWKKWQIILLSVMSYRDAVFARGKSSQIILVKVIIIIIILGSNDKIEQRIIWETHDIYTHTIRYSSENVRYTCLYTF